MLFSVLTDVCECFCHCRDLSACHFFSWLFQREEGGLLVAPDKLYMTSKLSFNRTLIKNMFSCNSYSLLAVHDIKEINMTCSSATQGNSISCVFVAFLYACLAVHC